MDSVLGRSALTALWLSGVLLGVCFLVIGYSQLALSGSYSGDSTIVQGALNSFPGADRIPATNSAMGSAGYVFMGAGAVVAALSAFGLFRMLSKPIRRPGSMLADTTEGQIGSCVIFGGGCLLGLYGIYTRGLPAIESLFSQHGVIIRGSMNGKGLSISEIANSVSIIPNLVTCLALAWMTSAGLIGFVVNLTGNERRDAA